VQPATGVRGSTEFQGTGIPAIGTASIHFLFIQAVAGIPVGRST